MNPGPCPFTCCVSLEDPRTGSDFSQHHKGVGCLGRSRLFPLQLHSFQVSGVHVACLNVKISLYLQLLLNCAWQDLNFEVLKEKPKQPQILFIVPLVLSNRGVSWTHYNQRFETGCTTRTPPPASGSMRASRGMGNIVR